MKQYNKQLLTRYFILEARLKTLNRIKQCICHDDFRRVNKLIFITKRKVSILEKHLNNI